LADDAWASSNVSGLEEEEKEEEEEEREREREREREFNAKRAIRVSTAFV